MRDCTPGLYLASPEKLHSQQYKWLKINPAAEEQQSVDRQRSLQPN